MPPADYAQVLNLARTYAKASVNTGVLDNNTLRTIAGLKENEIPGEEGKKGIPGFELPKISFGGGLGQESLEKALRRKALENQLGKSELSIF